MITLKHAYTLSYESIIRGDHITGIPSLHPETKYDIFEDTESQAGMEMQWPNKPGSRVDSHLGVSIFSLNISNNISVLFFCEDKDLHM